MPSKATIAKEYINNASSSPSFSGTSTSGVAIGVSPAGHITTNVVTGDRFVNLPSAGNAFLPARRLYNRFELEERFLQRPALNAVIGLPGSDSTSPTAAAFLAYNVANKDFEVLGSNMTTALCTFADGGGITITTAGGANTTDAAILTPHLDTTQSAWAATKWNTADEISFETVIKPVAVTTTKIYAGFKLTNTNVAATDDNQVYFVFDTADTLSVSTTNWVAVSTRAGVADIAIDTGIAASIANTVLRIQVDQNRIPYFFINGVLVAVGNGTETTGVTTSTGALTDDIDLIPYIGCIQKTNSTAAAVTIRSLRCGKSYND